MSRCRNGGKVRYETEKHAERALADARTDRKPWVPNHGHAIECRVYKCEACHGYHLTSRD